MMLMASGMNYGLGRTLPHMVGVTLGVCLMIALVGVGLGQVFVQFPVIHTVLKIVSVIYLLYLAWQIATADAPKEKTKATAAGDAHRPMTLMEAMIFQWVNPKAWTMCLTAVTVYLPPRPNLLVVLPVIVVFGVINFPSVGVWTLLGVQLRAWLTDPVRRRWFNWTAALLLVLSLYPIVLEH